MKKKIFVCQIFEESNSFNPIAADIEAFKRLGIYEGEEIVRDGAICGETMSAIINTLKETDCDIVCGRSLMMGSGGPIDAGLIDDYTEYTKKALKCQSFDGVVLSLHGATISTASEDVCGDLIEVVRNEVGKDTVISVAFDLHANVTPKIVKNADYVCGYLRYPHVDVYDVGVRAAKLAVKHINEGKMRLAMARVPVIAPAHAYTTERGKLKALMDKGRELVKSGKIIDFSVFQAQPWMDVSALGASIIVIAHDGQTAIEAANELAQDEFELREELQGERLATVDEVIRYALDNDFSKPVVISDSADSANAGSTGDSAEVLSHLLKYKDELVSAVAVVDRPALKKAFEIGVGGVADFVLGATIAPKMSKPVKVEGARVRSLHDGRFRMYGPQERGQLKNLNGAAVLEVGKISILVVGSSGNDGDKAFYSSFGIEPEFCQLVSVKACTSFRAVYEKFSEKIFNVQTSGSAGTVLQKLPFERRPRPLYPFEEIDGFEKAEIYR